MLRHHSEAPFQGLELKKTSDTSFAKDQLSKSTSNHFFFSRRKDKWGKSLGKELERVSKCHHAEHSTLFALFIYLTILKYLLLALTKNEKYRSTDSSLGEKGYMYSYGELRFLLYIQRKILIKKVLH